MQLFFREPVSVLGLAPLQQHVSVRRSEPAPLRLRAPEVHDSDGLALFSARAASASCAHSTIPSARASASYRLDSPRGFGLLQRDRSFRELSDLEQRYEERPSAWVEPVGDWGKGQLRLLEISHRARVRRQHRDAWVPDEVRAMGLRIAYRISFGSDCRARGVRARGCHAQEADG